MCRVYDDSLFDWDEYYDWLMSLVRPSGRVDYDLLFKQLFETEYVWVEANGLFDFSRASYGKRLREKYGDEHGFETPDYIFEKPCTVLEMLIALSIQIEERIMSEPGNYNPGYWFWEMIKNLGLDICVDYSYDGKYVQDCLDIWMNRRYRRNGVGGLFPLPGSTRDQRNTDTWMQLNEYILTNYCV